MKYDHVWLYDTMTIQDHSCLFSTEFTSVWLWQDGPTHLEVLAPRKTLWSVSTGKAWQWSALKLIKCDALTRASQLRDCFPLWHLVTSSRQSCSVDCSLKLRWNWDQRLPLTSSSIVASSIPKVPNSGCHACHISPHCADHRMEIFADLRWCVGANYCGLQQPLWEHHAPGANGYEVLVWSNWFRIGSFLKLCSSK